MFEPIAKILDKHGTTAVEVLKDVRKHLAEIVENTTARLETAQYGDHSGTANTGATTVAEVTLRTKEGFYWKVNQTAVTGGEKGNCAVYLGAVNPQNLIDVITPTGKNTSQAKYYVPPRASLIFHFYEQPNNQICTAHIQVDRFYESPEYDRRKSISREIIDSDRHLEPHRHGPPRTAKPSPEELRGRSIHKL